MRVRWKEFELPTRVVRDDNSADPNYGRFVIEPFERGFGTTIGNSIRRVLLSSIEGTSVTSVKFLNVPHEFSTIKNVREDVADIVLNIRKIIFKLNTDEPQKLTLEAHEKCAVKAGDIKPNANVEILNPGLHIATIVDDTDFTIELEIRKGRGYLPIDEDKERELGLIPVDSVFSPVKRVKYKTENTRVGKLTNYDKLLLEIWTNGTVSPELAMVESAKILRKHMNPFIQYFELGKELQINEKKEEEVKLKQKYLEELKQKLQMNISELDLSVRASNCLTTENVNTIEDLVKKGEQELLKVRNFGKTSLKEVKKKLTEMGLALGMDLTFLSENQ
ncbi:MAG: DNA-directed RNA polymerase subunit alpha [Planctomycetes bacterium]|nr:DNA-directed RNA polymerase subunit alpha [Planctomycetota bacterium]